MVTVGTNTDNVPLMVASSTQTEDKTVASPTQTEDKDASGVSQAPDFMELNRMAAGKTTRPKRDSFVRRGVVKESDTLSESAGKKISRRKTHARPVTMDRVEDAPSPAPSASPSLVPAPPPARSHSQGAAFGVDAAPEGEKKTKPASKGTEAPAAQEASDAINEQADAPAMRLTPESVDRTHETREAGPCQEQEAESSATITTPSSTPISTPTPPASPCPARGKAEQRPQRLPTVPVNAAPDSSRQRNRGPSPRRTPPSSRQSESTPRSSDNDESPSRVSSADSLTTPRRYVQRQSHGGPHAASTHHHTAGYWKPPRLAVSVQKQLSSHLRAEAARMSTLGPEPSRLSALGLPGLGAPSPKKAAYCLFNSQMQSIQGEAASPPLRKVSSSRRAQRPPADGLHASFCCAEVAAPELATTCPWPCCSWRTHSLHALKNHVAGHVGNVEPSAVSLPRMDDGCVLAAAAVR